MPAEPDDAGVTLLEVVVAMTIMSIFGSVFVAGIVQMYRSFDRADAVTAAQSQITIAFGRLDAEIRYASGFSTPGPDSGTDRYVEYVLSNTGTASCGELRLRGSTRQLQWRRWVAGTTPGTWTVLASNVSSGTPFTVTLPGTGSRNQTLTLALTSSAGGRSKELSTTFAALNSTPSTASSTACAEGRPAP